MYHTEWRTKGEAEGASRPGGTSGGAEFLEKMLKFTSKTVTFTLKKVIFYVNTDKRA